MTVHKKGLGKGLSALIKEVEEEVVEVDNKSSVEIDINKIEPNKSQPRKHFDEILLNELAESIIAYGIIQPIIVKKQNDYYEIIAGERRWRAARIAGLSTVPVIIKEYSRQETLEIALIENIQREDLNPMEEAESYKMLIDEFNLSQEQVSEKVGRSRSAIANSMRLLNLDKRVQNFVVENKITNGHARALLTLEDGNMQFEVAEKIIEEQLSVRQVEVLVKTLMEEKPQKIEKEVVKSKVDFAYKAIEREFSQIFGTKVQITNGKKKGKIEIEYYSDDDLDRLLTIVKSIEK
jgi:ParB family chromosome partitioning protein